MRTGADESSKLNPDVNPFQRSYVGEIRRIDEMARRVRFFTSQIEKEKEKILDERGDFCGGRGGELGRRLEAWLVVNGDAEGRVELPRRWAGNEGGGGEPT